jgi:rod shape-determining protein MreD
MAFNSLKFSLFSSPYFSLTFAFILNMLPWGNSSWTPDFLLVVLCFWVLQAPEKVNLLVALLLGLLMDIQTSQFLGVHAIVYVSSSFLIIYNQRRLLNTTSLGQIFIMLQIFLFANFVLLFILWVMGKNQEAQLSYLLIPSLLEVCLWPIFKRVLSSRLALINQNSS